MYRYIDDFLLEDDEIYQKIMINLNQFLDKMSSEEDKDLLCEMIKEAYLKYKPAINSKAGSDTELSLSLIMSLLAEQSNELDRLSSIKKH